MPMPHTALSDLDIPPLPHHLRRPAPSLWQALPPGVRITLRHRPSLARSLRGAGGLGLLGLGVSGCVAALALVLGG